MADTPSQSLPPSSSVSETETGAEEAPQEYRCYHCYKRVSVETVADLPDILCHDCKNGFVESIPRSDPTSQPSDQASDPFLQVLRLIAQAARDEDAPPPLPQNHPTRNSMADTPSQSPPPSSSVSVTETVAEEAPQEYWCYHCDKRVSVETVADLPDIVCHDCKNGFVKSIPRSDPPSQPSDQASDPYGSPFQQVLRLIAQAASDEDAPPPLPQNHPTRNSMADTPSQSPPPSSSVSVTETVAEEAPQEYWCYHCDKRVSVETVADLPDIVCHDCKNGFVESIPRSDPTSQPSDQASDPYGSPFQQVLQLIAQAASDEDAPPPLPQNHPTSEEDFLRIELDGWDNDEDVHSVEFHNEGGVENEEAEEEEEDRSDREEDENQERDEEDLRRRHRDVLRLRIRDFATRARSGRNQILDWAEILMGLEDNSIESRFEMPESDRYVGNPEDYVDAAGYEALLQTLAESDSSGRRGAPPEMLQAHSSLKTIKKKLIRKSLDMIRKLAEEDPDESNDKAKKDVEKSDDDDEKRGQYTRFWNEFGESIKLGIIEDAANRNRLAKLLRFESTKSDGKLTSLDQYISRMKSGQKDIFYLTGTSKEQLDNSPFLERLKKGYEVIFFTDPVDEYLMQYLMDYEDKKFQNVSKEGLKLGKDSKDKELKESYKELTKWWKGALASDNVDDVKLSNRLADTPCVVVTSKFGWSANMEKIMQSQTLSDSAKQAYMRGKRVLEINPRHPIIKELRERVLKNPEDESVKHTAQLIYQTALMESGFVLPDPKDFASRIYSSVKSSLNINPDATVEEEDDTEDPAEAETPANEGCC